MIVKNIFNISLSIISIVSLILFGVTGSHAGELSYQEFSLLTTEDLEVGESIDVDHLSGVGLSATQVDVLINSKNEFQYHEGVNYIKKEKNRLSALMDGQEFSVGRLMDTQANAPVSYYWTNREGLQINLRRNIKEKIESKHNLTWKVPRAVTNSYYKKYHVNGQKYSYEAEVHNIQCKGWAAWRKCQSVDKVIVITSVDFRTNTSDGKQFGVTTTYCKGRGDWCPDFVKNALNI